LKDFDLTNAKEFIEYWSKYYSDSVRILDSTDKISYIDELNLKNDFQMFVYFLSFLCFKAATWII